MTFSVTLPEELDKRCEVLSAKMHKSKQILVKEALENYLEDQEDYLSAWDVKKRILAGEEPTSSFDEVMKRCGLASS